jgi:hypothetical protein
MAHRIDSPPRRARRRLGSAEPATREAPQPAHTTEATLSAQSAVLLSGVLVAVCLLLMLLSIVGAAHVLPVSVRAVTISLVALTLPGLPIAALLRLPTNGIFASVTVAVSLATHILLAQADTVSGLGEPYLVQLIVLIIASAAVTVLARRALGRRDFAPASGLPTPAGVTFPRLGERKVGIGLLVTVACLFLSTVIKLHPEDAGAVGLLGVLGIEYFLGLGLLSVIFVIEYRRASIDRLMVAAANVVLIVYITMPVAWANRTAPFPTAYTHRSIANSIAQIGGLPPPTDARISWAGFFAATANMMRVSGIADSQAFLASASLVFSVLLMYPLYAVGLAISGNEKAAWLGVTLYILFNWYQQDYFAPQAVAMQFYATVVAVLLWQVRSADIPRLTGSWLHRVSRAWMRIPGRVTGRDGPWTQRVEAALVLVIAAMVIAHQLTPLITIVALALFAAMGLTRYKLLWIAAVVIFVAWFTYGADGFWQGHLGQIVSDIGGVDQNLNSSVSARIAGDPVYDRMQYLRIGAAFLLFATAGIGWLRMPRGDARPIAAALSVAPFGLVLVQSYGGEVAIRCFIYASVLLAPLAAMALLPLFRSTAANWPGVVATGFAGIVLFFVLSVWGSTNRGLNTSFEQTARKALGISDQLRAEVDPAKVMFWGQGLSYMLPGPTGLDDSCYANVPTLVNCTDATGAQYFVATAQDDNYLRYRYGFGTSDISRALDLLISERGFEMMYDGGEVRVLKRVDAPTVHVGTKQ